MKKSKKKFNLAIKPKREDGRAIRNFVETLSPTEKKAAQRERNAAKYKWGLKEK